MCYCDDCMLVDICGCESYYDESLTFCADKHRYILKSELKDIKAEIQKYITENKNSNDLYLSGCGDGAYHVLAIIDKHIKENKQTVKMPISNGDEWQFMCDEC